MCKLVIIRHQQLWRSVQSDHHQQHSRLSRCNQPSKTNNHSVFFFSLYSFPSFFFLFFFCFIFPYMKLNLGIRRQRGKSGRPRAIRKKGILFVCLFSFVCLFDYLFICLFIFFVPFSMSCFYLHLFASLVIGCLI